MTIKDLLVQSALRRPARVALRYKQDGTWRTLSYADLARRARQVSEALRDLRVKPGDRVGIYLPNCPEWPEVYFGIVALGAVAVPIDAKLREQEVAHILRDSTATVLFACAKTYQVVRDIEDSRLALGDVVLIGATSLSPETGRGVRYRDYEAALRSAAAKAAGADAAFDRLKPEEDDTASIIYTSGTTGRQKGAMLTHRNFCSNVQAALKLIDVVEGDSFLLVLPLHHSLAFTGNLLIPIAAGLEIGFVESLKTVSENIRELRPTVLIAVPLLIEKMYDRIWAGVRRNLLAYLLLRLGIRGPVNRGIIKKLGGRLRLVVVGGAPSSADVLRGYMRLGITILEGYGLTETAPILTLNPMDRPRPGTVGRPLSGVEIKILDPNPDGVGEIAARGPNVMPGYYRNEEATKQAFADGWFLTGDLGFIDAEGYVTITGRKKSLIVNREGKNIYPEEVEGFLTASEYIREALVLGYQVPGETGERLGAIVVPDQEAVDRLVRRHKRPLTDEEVNDLMRKEVARMGLTMADYKHPRRIQVRHEEFEKTSTGKIKRYLYALNAADV